jgi:hypothetical protein
LRWTTKSTEHLAQVLREMGHVVSPDTVGRLSKEAPLTVKPSMVTPGTGTVVPVGLPLATIVAPSSRSTTGLVTTTCPT